MRVFLILLILLPVSSFASPLENIKKLTAEYNTPFHDSYSLTVNSSCRLPKYKPEDLSADHLTLSVRNGYYQSGKTKINLFLKKDKTTGAKKAPLLVLITGIFGHPLGGISSQIVKKFTDDGFHVLSLGNPLGLENLSERPRYILADFYMESNAYYETIKTVRRMLLRRNLLSKGVFLYGISYGGFVAGVINSLDLLGDKFIDKTALISPPVRFGKAIQNMDALVNQSRKFQSYPDWILSLMSIPYCFKPKPEPSAERMERAKAIFTFSGFQRSLADTISYADKLYGWGYVPRSSRSAFRRWRQRVTFSYYFENFFPVLKELYYSRKSYLFNWINVRQDNILILSASDDPLNINVSWPGSDNIFLTKMGGHYGFANSEFYNNFLTEVSAWMKK